MTEEPAEEKHCTTSGMSGPFIISCCTKTHSVHHVQVEVLQPLQEQLAAEAEQRRGHHVRGGRHAAGRTGGGVATRQSLRRARPVTCPISVQYLLRAANRRGGGAFVISWRTVFYDAALTPGSGHSAGRRGGAPPARARCRRRPARRGAPRGPARRTSVSFRTA